MSEQQKANEEGAHDVSPLEIDPATCMDTIMGIEDGEPSYNSGVVTPNGTDHSTSSRLSTPNKQSGIFGTSSNLINSIVGAGIIGIPYAFRQSGFVAGVLLLVLVAYLTGTFNFDVAVDAGFQYIIIFCCF